MINYRGLNIPRFSFGNVSSDDLFCEKEQAIYDFYQASKDRYRKAVDIGSNIGVHTILMLRQGWEVQAWEPDPVHMAEASKNIAAHWPDRSRYKLCDYAVDDRGGKATFVRQLGNTTGSHIKGDKSAYGELEEFQVDVADCRPLFMWADFAKIDCEGAEARILRKVPKDCRCEFMVEVGNVDNALAIWEHFWPTDYKLYSQKRGWSPCRGLKDMPKHHSEGALFIGRNPPFPTST